MGRQAGIQLEIYFRIPPHERFELWLAYKVEENYVLVKNLATIRFPCEPSDHAMKCMLLFCFSRSQKFQIKSVNQVWLSNDSNLPFFKPKV